MSSISTLILQNDKTIQDNKTLYKKTRYHMGYISWCLWTFAAIIEAAARETNTKVDGVALTFNVQDVLMMLLTTCMLIRGLTGGNPYLVYPWIVVSSWNIYYWQYPSLIKMLFKLQQARQVSILVCFFFGIEVIAMVMKALLIVRIVQLSVDLWYQRKLQCETLRKI